MWCRRSKSLEMKGPHKSAEKEHLLSAQVHALLNLVF